MQRQGARLVAAAIGLAVFLGRGAALAATTVVVDAGGGGDYTTLEAAFSNLVDDTTILVRPGTYQLTATLGSTNKNLTVRSARADTGEIDAANTILDGSDFVGQGICSRASTPVFDGLTFRNFTHRGSGAAIYVDGAGSYQIRNCIFTDNLATNNNGGAICAYGNWGGVISNCVFRGNRISAEKSGYGGGAVFIMQPNYTSRGQVVDCLFTNNWACGAGSVRGGALWSLRGVEILRCRFVDNWAQATGGTSRGGTVSAGTSSRIVDSSFSTRNTADRVTVGSWGRLVELYDGVKFPHAIEGCTFGPLENDGAGASSIIYIDGSFGGETVVNSVFKDLAVDGKIFDTPNSITGVVRNCLFARNRPPAFVPGAAGNSWTYENCTFVQPSDGTVLQSAASSTFVNCLCNGLAPAGAVLTNSLFAGTTLGCGFVRAGHDWRLAPDSPAVNAGVALAWHADAKDVGGRSRVAGAAVDIGAYERQGDDPEACFARVVASEEDRAGEWSEAHVGIQAGVDAAADGEVLLVRAGHYKLTAPVEVRNRSLSIRGEGVDRTIVDAQGASRCLVGVISSPGYGLSISGVTFTNGCAGLDVSATNFYARGGGVYLSCVKSLSRIALADCRVTGCCALAPLDEKENIPDSGYFRGAAVYAVQYCTFDRCRFDGNVASNTFATVGIEPAGTAGVRDSGMRFSDCIVSNCQNLGKPGSSGSFCAGVYTFNNYQPVWIENSVFARLTGNKYFNLLKVNGGSTVTNCVFSDSQASYSAVCFAKGESSFADCVFSNIDSIGTVDGEALCDRCVFRNCS